ncbi:MAG: hypothetical protein CDV28_14716 [Candidatus Electronema aureum]|uniref:Uncharacterized protein n=1 Tax=Candidatus Electronema aureum TaxID=2005002 RepID=A0A521FYV4_9BACT|nr:MAG: hypothetical protein CDV28_14716 [Candidatus Electronema aureum]
MEVNFAKSITINSSYAELLPSFNDDLQSAVDAALQRYLIDEIAAKIAGLKKKEKLFSLKYSCDYKTFSQRTAEDEEYINQIESSISKLWESDLANWEFCEKGINDWTKKLQSILLLS